jgi:transposase
MQISENETTKYRTTFYLTEENKKLLDQIPRGNKTALINEALSRLLKDMEREKNKKKLQQMISAITLSGKSMICILVF